MAKTFQTLKAEAQNASSASELFQVAKASNDKLIRNINKAKLMSFQHGRAAEAGHYFENVIPTWSAINDEIHSMLRAAMSGKSAEEIVSIVGAGNPKERGR